MRKLCFFLLCTSLSWSSITFPARAEIGAIDAVPAATLLLPYFEVGLENSGNTRTTLFSINNAKSESVIVHVTLWSTLGRPSIDFDVFLTGYDVQTYNLADLFLRGELAANPILDPGEFSSPNEIPDSCQFPLPTQLPDSLFQYLRNVHTGLPAPSGFVNSGLCGAPSQGADEAGLLTAMGYITMDVTNECTLTFPGEDGYFGDGGSAIVSNNNTLWGDFFLVDPANAFAQGDNLVHIEAADSVASGFWESGDTTFYGRYHDFDARDNREPLATVWASRYFSGSSSSFTTASDFFVWRDSGQDDSTFFQCGNLPSPYPLGHRSIVGWDEEENVSLLALPFPQDPPEPFFRPPFALAADRVSADDIGTVFDAGWIRFDLKSNIQSEDAPPLQSHVSAVHSASGQFSVGFQAVALDSALDKTFTVTTAPEDDIPSEPPPNS